MKSAKTENEDCTKCIITHRLQQHLKNVSHLATSIKDNQTTDPHSSCCCNPVTDSSIGELSFPRFSPPRPCPSNMYKHCYKPNTMCAYRSPPIFAVKEKNLESMVFRSTYKMVHVTTGVGTSRQLHNILLHACLNWEGQIGVVTLILSVQISRFVLSIPLRNAIKSVGDGAVELWSYFLSFHRRMNWFLLH